MSSIAPPVAALLASTPSTHFSRTARSWRLGWCPARLQSAIIFLVVDVLAGGASAPWPWLANPSALLMAAAVLAQGLQSLMRYGNKV